MENTNRNERNGSSSVESGMNARTCVGETGDNSIYSPPRTPQSISPQRNHAHSVDDKEYLSSFKCSKRSHNDGTCEVDSSKISIFSPFKHHAAVGYDEDQRAVFNQNSCNMHAILAALVLGRLGGYMLDDLASPVQSSLRSAMDALLTPCLAKLLCQSRPWELLHCLNENVESPGKIWNTNMRKELLQFLEQQTIARDRDCSNTGCASREEDLISTTDFKFECLKSELCIDYVYLRLFNHSGGNVGEVAEPTRFCRQLLLFLCSYTERIGVAGRAGALTPPPTHRGSGNSNSNSGIAADIAPIGSLVIDELYEAANPQDTLLVAEFHRQNACKNSTLRARHFDQVAEAINLLAHGQEHIAADVACFPRGIRALFGVMCKKYSASHAPCFYSAVESIQIFSSNTAFVGTCSATEHFPDRFPVLQLLYCACEGADDKSADALWSLLHQFTATSSGIHAVLACGAVLRILGVIFGVKGSAGFFSNRRSAAALLSKLLLHPQHGPDTAITLQQFLPLPLIQKLRSVSSGEASVRCLDESTDNPELI
jgi:hypothetical protein